ncbi:MAG: hypothetical protein HUK14_05995 [Muribaculaceae bacterium]|nr:hypothetical protein [Muribaculaceae bacterium]
MKTIIKLNIKGVVHELAPDCLKNWDEVLCTYKRSDYSGIIRSFTSKFQFFGKGYELLLAEYLADRYMADVNVSVWTINNDWTYTKQFECPLDFSTVQIENGVFSISAIDNSVAALIKANKSTKYEMKVGTDLDSDGVFHFDRLPMTESVTYGFTDGTSEENTGAIQIHLNSSEGLWLGSIGDEISIGRTIFWNDDQEGESDSYMIRALKDVSVVLESTIVVDSCFGEGIPQRVYVQQLWPTGSVKVSVTMCTLGDKKYTDCGQYTSLAQLQAAYPEHTGTPQSDENYIATINGIVWIYAYNGWQTAWQNTNQTKEECDILRQEYSLKRTFNMNAGDKIRAKVAWNEGTTVSARILSSSIHFSWKAKGEKCDIPAFKPLTVLEGILCKMCSGHTNAVGKISGHDSRLAYTVLMAAEDIRAIPESRFYSSFNDYCDWMETVFGYTYYLGNSWESKLTGTTQNFGGMVDTPYSASSGIPPAEVSTDNIKYNTSLGKFMLCQGGYWYSWSGSNAYNFPGNSGPRTDRLFYDGNKYYYFQVNESGSVNPTPIVFQGDPADKELPFQEIVFVHRSELFSPQANVKIIDNPTDVRHSVNSASIYSTVEIGYDKKEYDNINGRDEFNFSNTYSTGCSVSTKKLSLISKYRADCYGIEFAAQKRDADTTDSTSDNDVFFAHVIVAGRDFKPDRTMTVLGALSDSVFNATFSPISCVRKNAGYIGMQAAVLKLAFASSTGNSDIKIGGWPMSGNITLMSPLLISDEVEFVTDDLQLPHIGDLISIEKNGLRYTGFINEVEERFAREEAVKYKLLVKSIELC